MDKIVTITFTYEEEVKDDTIVCDMYYVIKNPNYQNRETYTMRYKLLTSCSVSVHIEGFEKLCDAINEHIVSDYKGCKIQAYVSNWKLQGIINSPLLLGIMNSCLTNVLWMEQNPKHDIVELERQLTESFKE